MNKQKPKANLVSTITISMQRNQQQQIRDWIESTGFYPSLSEFARVAIMMKIRRTFLAWARISPGVSVLKDIAEVSVNLPEIAQIEQYTLPVMKFTQQVRRQIIADKQMSRIVYRGFPEKVVRFTHVRVI